MKTLKQIREEYDSQFLDLVENLPEEVMLESAKKTTSLMSTTPSFKQMPSLLVFRRITYRKYPNDQVVALYYSSLVDKYLSIPFGPTGNLNLSEAVVHDEYELNEDLRKWFKEKWVRYDTKGNIKGDCAREEGEGKPKCRPLASARAMSKEERAKSARRKRREDPVADRPGKGGKPVMVRTEETLLEKNVPTNPALWARAKAQARAKFDVYPSAYANGWASKWYKSKGGGWKSSANESVDEACWSTHKQVGWKKKGKRMVPDCVLKEGGFDTDAVASAIRDKESGTSGGYNAKSKSSSASGAYQYINKTWRNSASKYDIDTKQFPTARSAPKEVQDKVFMNDLQRNASKYGSLEKAVNVHYSGNPEGKVSSAGLKANRGQTGGGYMADIKKRVDDYNTERKSTMGAAQQMAANFSGGKTLTTPDSTQFAKAPEAPKPTQVASAEPPKMQNPDQERTKVASADTKKIAESAAWTRKAGQDPKGGLNRKGIASYRAQNPGSNLSMAVTRKPSTLDPKGKAAKRRKSFCARMGGMKKRLTSAKTARDPDSRINKALRKWNCEESFNVRLYELRQERNKQLDENPIAALGTLATAARGLATKEGLKKIAKGGLRLAKNAIAKKLAGSDSSDTEKKQAPEPTTYSTEFGRTRSAKGKTVTLVPTSQGSDPASQSRASSLENKYREKSLQASQANENKMSDIRKMVKEGIEFKDLTINGRTVTLNTSMAKRILEVYDSVNTKNKKIVEGMLNEDMESFKKLLNFSIKA